MSKNNNSNPLVFILAMAVGLLILYIIQQNSQKKREETPKEYIINIKSRTTIRRVDPAQEAIKNIPELQWGGQMIHTIQRAREVDTIKYPR